MATAEVAMPRTRSYYRFAGVVIVLLSCLISAALAASNGTQLEGPASHSEVKRTQWAKKKNYTEGIDKLSPLAQSLYTRIKDDLKPWEEIGITQEMVEHTYCTEYDRSFRLQIVDGRMYIAGEAQGFYEFNRMTKIFLLDVAAKYQLPDLDVMISTADNCPDYRAPIFPNATKCPFPAPLLSNSRQPWQNHCALFPTFSFGSGGWPMPYIPSWQSYLNLMSMVRDVEFKPWKERIAKLFFRGAPTGSRADLFKDLTLQKSRIEGSLTSWTEQRRTDEHISLAEHCDYKYLLHLPGHGYSVRLKYLMLCGSSIVFYDNGMDEFWYHILQDRKHILRVPMKDSRRDAAALLHGLKILETNPELAEKVAEGGREFVEEVLTVDNVERYFAGLLTEYAKLQKFTPQVHQNAVPFRMSVLGPDATYNVYARECSHCTFDADAHFN